MKKELIAALFQSGIHEYITVNKANGVLAKYYEPLVDSILMFQESLNEYDKEKILWLMHHSTLFINGVKLQLSFDGYDLGLRDKFLQIINEMKEDLKEEDQKDNTAQIPISREALSKIAKTLKEHKDCKLSIHLYGDLKDDDEFDAVDAAGLYCETCKYEIFFAAVKDFDIDPTILLEVKD